MFRGSLDPGYYENPSALTYLLYAIYAVGGVREVGEAAFETARVAVALVGTLVVGLTYWAGARFYFEKVSDRHAWDFPLVNVASAMQVDDGKIKDVRLAVGGVAARPLRLHAVEDSVRGESPSKETAELAGKTAIWGARPLNYNHFKIPLLKNLVQRAIREA